MNELVEKKVRSAKVFRICLLILLALAIASFAAMGVVDKMEVVILPAMLFLNALWICGVLYYAKMHPLMSSIKWLERLGASNVVEDIPVDAPTLPKSKIHCGRWALFSKKPCAIIPYAQVAWVHLYERRAYGVAVEKAIIIYAKDGRKFALNADEYEFRWLLENYIIPQSPDIIIGYGAEQKARFKQLNPKAANAEKRLKRIGGIALMAFGAFLLVVGLVNQAIIGPGLVIVIGLLGAGAGLFFAGRKNS